FLLHIAGTEEKQRFGRAVKKHVQECCESAEFAAEAQCRDHDAGVIDAGISQYSTEIPLHQNERSRQQDGEDTKADQQLAGKCVTETFFSQHIEAHDAVDRAIDESSA